MLLEDPDDLIYLKIVQIYRFELFKINLKIWIIRVFFKFRWSKLLKDRDCSSYLKIGQKIQNVQVFFQKFRLFELLADPDDILDLD